MRILLATDRPDLGHALTLFLSERQFDVIAVASDARELITLATTTRPDIVLVDWQLAGGGSAGAVADLKASGQQAPVIVMSTIQERPLARMAHADGYITLGDPPETLLEALREVLHVTR